MLEASVIYVSILVLAPILAIVLIDYIRLNRKSLLYVCGIATIHLIMLLVFDVSLRGDLLDYIFYGIEYCLIIYLALRTIDKLPSRLSKIFNSLSLWALLIFTIFALIITPFVMVLMQETFPKRTHQLENDFELREYRYGFATLESTTFTFALYRTFWIFEQKLTEAKIEDTKTELELYSEKLKFDLNLKRKEIRIRSENGRTEKFPI